MGLFTGHGHPVQLVDATDSQISAGNALPVAVCGSRSEQGAVAGQLTTTSPAILISAGAAGIYNDILSLTFANEGTTASLVTISDGTVARKFAVPAAIDTRGQSFSLAPMKATSAATAWTIQLGTQITMDYSAEYMSRQSNG